jgi:hypothetical protein
VAAVTTVAGGVTVSLPSNVPLKGTWRFAAAEPASGDDVKDAPIDDGTDVGLAGNVV